jgi:hypothetical protein
MIACQGILIERMMSSFPMNLASGYLTTVVLCGSKGAFMLGEPFIRCQSMIHSSWHGGQSDGITNRNSSLSLGHSTPKNTKNIE